MRHDIRAAIRAIVKDRWLAAAAIVALALGIGVNATIFTLVNAVLIRGLPFHDSHNLYVLGTVPMQPGATDRVNPASYQDLQDWKAQSQAFADMAAFTQMSYNLADDHGMPEQVNGALVSENLFKLLGQQPLLGRDFSAEDGQGGAEKVVILGNAVWKNRYGGDMNVLGRGIRLSGTPAVIIGVMPPGMRFPTRADLWTQIVPDASATDRGRRTYSVAGRLRPGSTRAAAQTELSGIARADGRRLSGHQQGGRGDAADVQRAVQRRRDPAPFPDAAGRGRLRAADRLRQRRQPSALARRFTAPARWRCARRSAPAAGASCGSCWSRASCSGSPAAPWGC